MAISQKNASLSPAVADLGLGDMLKTQLDDAEEERKKKLLSQAKGGMGVLGPATQSLFATAGGFGG